MTESNETQQTNELNIRRDDIIQPASDERFSIIRYLKRNTLGASILRIAIISAVMWIILFNVQLPFMFEAPGSAVDISDLIQVQGTEKPRGVGKFFLTAVLYERANILLYVWGRLDSSAELTPYKPEDKYMSGKDRDDYMKTQMENSKMVARIAAFRALGYKVAVERSPVTITEILDISNAKGVLNIGDVLLEVDGHPIKKETDLSAYLEKRKTEATPHLVISRNGTKMEFDIPLKEIDGKKKLWIMVRSKILKADLPRDVVIKSNNIIGASAGLMFTLEIMRQASGVDLTGGNRIAGTGAIDENGKVLPISGARFKVIAAEREGAQYFLVPEKNYADAVKGATKLKVISVNTLQDALDALEKISPGASVDEYRERILKQGAKN